MNIYRLDPQQPLNLPPSIVTIGNFDGVHLGHQAMLAQLNQIAKYESLHRAVMIFEPQPLEFFLKHQAPPRVSNLREKIVALKDYGVDSVIIAKFDERFRNLTAQDFANILKHHLNAKILMLGDDFHFAKNREGNSDFLRQCGFEVHNLNTIDWAEQRVSSTRIRQVLQHGDFSQTKQLLGRPYRMQGRVLHGDKIGRTLDFPTINVALQRQKPCLHGIYAVEVQCLDSDIFQELIQQEQGIQGYSNNSLFGAAHVGTRPAIAQEQPEWRLEVHFPKLKADLYGRMMQVTFLHYLHGEKNYPSLEALKQGIQQDVQDLIVYRQTTSSPF
ncbi:MULTISPECIES: bifunctional riboflavin kinase/FAD synthetase [unclassified Acinetobacter]|uniref:bifunctional riboflavin kinase/FAD synthetase n=1 Tax=unclassified Acinetobacter TaxID=196816 RepID=UPI0035B9088D